MNLAKEKIKVSLKRREASSAALLYMRMKSAHREYETNRSIRKHRENNFPTVVILHVKYYTALKNHESIYKYA